MDRKQDLIWGVRNGLIIGVIYAAVALILYGADGSRRFDKLHVPVFYLIGVYLGGGLCAGTVLGIFRPALRDRYSAFVVGVVAAMPVAFGMTILVTGRATEWTMAEWTTTAFASLFIAGLGVAVLWRDPEDVGGPD